MGASGSKSWAGKLACLASPPPGLCPPGPAAAAVQHLAARCGPGWGLGRSWAVPGRGGPNLPPREDWPQGSTSPLGNHHSPTAQRGRRLGRRKVAAGPSLKREGRAGRLPAALRRKARPGDHRGSALGGGAPPSPTCSLKLKQDSETAARSHRC